jgi:hypothetical protein
MLTLFRSTRGAKEVSRYVRTLTTIAPSASSPEISAAEHPHDTPLDKTTVTRKQRNRLARSDAECMFVSPWNGIRSSAEGLAIASAIQEKYGPAKEVIFPRVRHVSRAPSRRHALHLLDNLFTGPRQHHSLPAVLLARL